MRPWSSQQPLRGTFSVTPFCIELTNKRVGDIQYDFNWKSAQTEAIAVLAYLRYVPHRFEKNEPIVTEMSKCGCSDLQVNLTFT